MSSIKDYFFEVQQEKCIEWIRKTYGLEVDPDEDEDQWAELAAEYSAMLDAEEEAAEFEWLHRHSHSQFFLEFSAELETAFSLLTISNSPSHTGTINKLVYAHAVTLLETLISSVIQKLLVSERDLLLSLITHYKKLNGIPITLQQIAQEPKIVESTVLKKLSELSFHNVSTIQQVLQAMFGDAMKGIDVSAIGRITDKRHDIVHRNGKTIKDEPIQLTTEEVQQAIRSIRSFAEDLKSRINSALTARDVGF
ncbi:HEPN domain-containing protein [Pseudomonas sp. HLS-6 TE3448]